MKHPKEAGMQQFKYSISVNQQIAVNQKRPNKP
jgi:hypothetical protein